MAKITLEQLEHTLAQHEIEPKKREEIIKDLERSIEEEKDHTEKKTRKKSSFILVQPWEDTLYYLIKVKDDFDLKTLKETFDKVMVIYNSSKKGMKTPARNIKDTIELAKLKTFKENGIQLLTKEPLVIIIPQ